MSLINKKTKTATPAINPIKGHWKVQLSWHKWKVHSDFPIVASPSQNLVHSHQTNLVIMSNFNLSGSRPINYNIFANYCQEVFDLYKTLDRLLHRNSASIKIHIEWMYWREELFLKHTKKLFETCRHTKYQEMPSLDYKLVISELQQCLEDMKQVCSKLGLQEIIFIDSVCIKIARMLQLIQSISSCISDNETPFFDMLPDNVIVSIFNHLPIKTRTSIELVNKRWFQLSRDSWGFLRQLNTEDYYAIQNGIS